MADAPSRLIGELTFADIATQLGARSTLCLPFGSIEQHGPHLPLNTDALLAETLTSRIIERWAPQLDLWQLPTLSMGFAREHEWAPGTLSLSIEGVTAMIKDLGRAITRLPTRNLAIVNCHGGNRGLLEVLILDLRADLGLNVCVLHPTVWAETMEASSGIPEIHGGKVETSMMLAVAPHLVHMDRLKQALAADVDVIRRRILDKAVSWPWTTDDKGIAAMGVIGDPQGAAPEFGQRLIAHAVEKAGHVLGQLLER